MSESPRGSRGLSSGALGTEVEIRLSGAAGSREKLELPVTKVISLIFIFFSPSISLHYLHCNLASTL